MALSLVSILSLSSAHAYTVSNSDGSVTIDTVAGYPEIDT